jgi:glycosyltransferase involved in cell wall biosynthesis
MKTKVLFFLPNLNAGGAERITVNILRQLDLEKFDITLVLVHEIGSFLKLIPKNIDVIDLDLNRTIFSIMKLRKIILELSPEVIFSTLIHTHISINLALMGMKNKPKSIFRSSSSPKLLIENNQLSFVLRKLLEHAYRNADKVLAQTPEMKSELIEYHGVHSSKIDVFLNPVDVEFIDEKLIDIINPFSNSTINVVAAGRLVHEKGFDVLIKSFKTVVQLNDQYRLYIIGNGSNKETEKHLKLIEQLNLQEYITLLGFQENPYKYFYFCDLYVLSSRREGLPNTILENLYLKKPIIATRCIPFMNVLIEDGKNGILVDVDNISSLSEAICNYKIIDASHKTVNFSNEQLEEVFVKFKHNKS